MTNQKEVNGRMDVVKIRMELVEENVVEKKAEVVQYQERIMRAIYHESYGEVADWSARLQAVASEIEALQRQLMEIRSLVKYMHETIEILKNS